MKQTLFRMISGNIFARCQSWHQSWRYWPRTIQSGPGSPKNSIPNWVTLPLYHRARKFKKQIALIDRNGTYQYGHLLNLSNALANKISHFEVKQKNVAFLCENDASYVVAKWAIWMNLGCAVPLSKLHPRSELEYFIKHSDAKLVIATEEYANLVESITSELNIDLLLVVKDDYILDRNSSKLTLDEASRQRGRESTDSMRDAELSDLLHVNGLQNLPALIVYTSGTTGRPKGVVHTFGSLEAQMNGMVKAWKWTEQDAILHVLPLHHVHGIVNALMTPFHVGAACVMMETFEPKQVWANLTLPLYAEPHRPINVFMGVPTMYAKLISYHKENCDQKEWKDPDERPLKAVCQNNFRLMVSGSAPLPETLLGQWENITGIQLLERYGMTEVGMALTDPLEGERVPGAVGMPFPQVEVCIVEPESSDTEYKVLVKSTGKQTHVDIQALKLRGSLDGDLHIKSPSLFSYYYNNEEATKDSFTHDGWFKTGDTASFENGTYRILGRSSVDIIKSGGFKIGALDIERHLLAHENICDAAVVGIPDGTWGQRVAAVLVLRDPSKTLTIADLREWGKDKIASYQLPTVIEIMPAIPRNVMGKVDKKDLLRSVFAVEQKNV